MKNSQGDIPRKCGSTRTFKERTMINFINTNSFNRRCGAHNRKEGRLWSDCLLVRVTRAGLDRLARLAATALLGELYVTLDLEESIYFPETVHVSEPQGKETIKAEPETLPEPVVEEVVENEPQPLTELAEDTVIETVHKEAKTEVEEQPERVLAQPHFASIATERTVVQATTLLTSAETVHSSLYKCGGCDEEVVGRNMKAPLINSRGIIPSDDKIVAESRCKWCTRDEGGWLAGTLKYARQARENKGAYAVRLMKASLHGDPEKPERVRSYYLRTNKEPERASKALAVYGRMIKGCSSSELFESNAEACKLLAQAQEWSEAEKKEIEQAAAKKRQATIRTRIQNGRLSRAENTLKAAMRELPRFDWTQLEAELIAAKAEIERSSKIEDLKKEIVTEFEKDDIDEMFSLIERGQATLPGFDWESFGEQILNG